MTTDGVSELDLIRWSEALAGIARTGLAFTESQYERERFEEILAVAGDIKASRAGTPADGHVSEWLSLVEKGSRGYVTPKIAVGAIVGNDDGEVLLIQRSDSGHWLYPTGWADVGYSPAEVALKEVHEETGIEAEVVGLIGVLDGLRRGFSGIPLYSMVFHLRAVGGSLDPHPLECLDAGFFSFDALPDPLAGSANVWDLVESVIRGEQPEPFFDLPRRDVWRPGR